MTEESARTVRMLAESLDDAARNRTTVSSLSARHDLDVAAAYQVQEQLVALREARGERIIGGKLGLTSKAKQVAMGVHQPLYGIITSDMVVRSGGPLVLSRLIHPRVEPEVAFILKAPVSGPDASASDVLAATSYVCAALDVIDSRYEGFSFTYADAVADNASSAAFTLGDDLVAPTMDLALAGCVLEVDGEVTATATGAAVLGHPAASVAFMANELAVAGKRLEAGWVVLSGGLTAPVPMVAGRTVTATIAGVGSVSLTAKAAP
jgi:2-oxo-3-hexenedioate decarboxylase